VTADCVAGWVIACGMALIIIPAAAACGVVLAREIYRAFSGR
jgi:hypothetical protein